MQKAAMVGDKAAGDGVYKLAWYSNTSRHSVLPMQRGGNVGTATRTKRRRWCRACAPLDAATESCPAQGHQQQPLAGKRLIRLPVRQVVAVVPQLAATCTK